MIHSIVLLSSATGSELRFWGVLHNVGMHVYEEVGQTEDAKSKADIGFNKMVFGEKLLNALLSWLAK